MDRKLLLTLGLSVATLMAFHYFTSSDQSGGNVGVPEVVRPGQSYTVPTSKDLAQPVSTEIDFIDKKISQKEDIKIIETDLCKIGFSTYGGVISTIDFLKHIGKNDLPLRTIQHKSFYEREDSAFLLALDEKTPYYYNLKELTNLDDRYDILFEAESEGWLIQKRYRLYKNTYKVDLFLDFEPKSKDAKSIRPRLFFPAPFIGEIPDDKVEAFSVDVSGQSITKIPEKDLNKIWVMPSIFGAENKYFAHCTSGDQNNFVQRSFFRLANRTIYPVLQGPEITGKSDFNISFYVGPKLVDDLGIVDERLEVLLSFGWLSWLCKLLLKLLKLIYSYLGNFGYAIIVLSIVLKIPFIPLSISSKNKMEEYNKYNPTVNRIRMKYKNDLKLQGEEISKFYKDHNISVATPALGCLPLLIQAPIMFALYRVLGGYLDLYQAPFFGWITDLSSKDPYYVLPILMGLSMLWQQMSTPVADARQKSMMFFLPLIMTFIFVSFPSGLVLYWLTNNLFMVGEDYLKKLIYR